MLKNVTKSKDLFILPSIFENINLLFTRKKTGLFGCFSTITHFHPMKATNFQLFKTVDFKNLLTGVI